MSYLGFPRICFQGEFEADPSTINNDPANFNPSVPITNPGWNPNGTHRFVIKPCVITGVVRSDGRFVDRAADDPFIGGSVATTNLPRPGRIVDLDPEEQGRSQLFGLGLRLRGSDGRVAVEGGMATATLRDLWFGRAPGGMAGAGGFYQSVLEHLDWRDAPGSSAVAELRDASPDRLSVRFVVHAYDVASHAGRLVGAIGPQMPDEPRSFASRALERVGSQLWRAPFAVDAVKGLVSIDLANALPEVAPDGERINLGTLEAGYSDSANRFQPIGELRYDRGRMRQRSGIEDLGLNSAALAALSGGALVVRRTAGAAQTFVLTEPTHALIDTESVALRMEPDNRVEVRFRAFSFGSPIANQVISVAAEDGQPTPGLDFDAVLNTDAAGEAVLRLRTVAGGAPSRGLIGGSLYRLAFFTSHGSPARPAGTISVRVFERQTPVAAPTWNNVAPILRDLYARLYPGMRAVMAIGEAATYRTEAARALIRAALTRPFEDPGYMPVTRDLSAGQRDLIVRWLDAGSPG
jgi:hypothetical protein